MTKDKWEEAYKTLDKYYYEFSNIFTDWEYGKNKTIKHNAESPLNNKIYVIDNYIRNNHEVYMLLIGDKTKPDEGLFISYDEFLIPRYLNNDLPRLLSKIRERINDIEATE